MRLRADGEEAASAHRSARVEGDREWTDRLKYELELAGVFQAGARWREDWDQVCVAPPRARPRLLAAVPPLRSQLEPHCCYELDLAIPSTRLARRRRQPEPARPRPAAQPPPGGQVGRRSRQALGRLLEAPVRLPSLLSPLCEPCHPSPLTCAPPRHSLASTSDLAYPSGISLLSLKNHLLVSYLQHLVALFSLKLNGRSLTDTDGPATVVHQLVKLRVVLEKIAPLEQKLKYQVEKLVRKADQFDDEGAQNEEDVLNGASPPSPPSLPLAGSRD